MRIEPVRKSTSDGSRAEALTGPEGREPVPIGHGPWTLQIGHERVRATPEIGRLRTPSARAAAQAIASRPAVTASITRSRPNSSSVASTDGVSFCPATSTRNGIAICGIFN